MLRRFMTDPLQPYLPLNPDDKKMLSPSTIFNTVCSFLSNTNLQHYSGEIHLSYFSQLFAICWNQFVSPVAASKYPISPSRTVSYSVTSWCQ